MTLRDWVAALQSRATVPKASLSLWAKQRDTALQTSVGPRPCHLAQTVGAVCTHPPMCLWNPAPLPGTLSSLERRHSELLQAPASHRSLVTSPSGKSGWTLFCSFGSPLNTEASSSLSKEEGAAPAQHYFRSVTPKAYRKHGPFLPGRTACCRFGGEASCIQLAQVRGGL